MVEKKGSSCGGGKREVCKQGGDKKGGTEHSPGGASSVPKRSLSTKSEATQHEGEGKRSTTGRSLDKNPNKKPLLCCPFKKKRKEHGKGPQLGTDYFVLAKGDA